MTTMEDVFFTGADLIASHNLLTYLRRDLPSEHLRLITGLGMSALGYRYGPELSTRIREVKDKEIASALESQILPVAGGMVAGGVAGYLWGSREPASAPVRGTELLEKIEQDLLESTTQVPGGIVTLGSIAYLAYSVLLHEQGREQRERQLWSLGAGAAGYLWGPEMLRALKDLAVPQSVAEDVEQRYTKSAMLFGAVAGGGLGMYLGRKPALATVRPLERIR